MPELGFIGSGRDANVDQTTSLMIQETGNRCRSGFPTSCLLPTDRGTLQGGVRFAPGGTFSGKAFSTFGGGISYSRPFFSGFHSGSCQCRRPHFRRFSTSVPGTKTLSTPLDVHHRLRLSTMLRPFHLVALISNHCRVWAAVLLPNRLR